MKAVLQYRASPGFVARIERDAPDWLDVVVVGEADRDRFALEIADAQVLLHALEPVTAHVFDAAPMLALVQKIGVGLNTIDLDAARRLGVGVANMPGTNTEAVAELAVALVLAVLRRIVTFDARTRSGLGWEPDFAAVDACGEVCGRTVGIVGYGHVGSRVAAIMAAFGARVVYTSRSPKEGALGEWRELDALLAESDIVSLHVPLTPGTDRLLDAGRIERMKPGAVLVNTARGGLVDQDALVAALDSGHLRGAGLDVFAAEPLDPADPVLARDDVVVMPHLAWLTPETLERSLGMAFENCRRLRDGTPLLHEILPATRPVS